MNETMSGSNSVEKFLIALESNKLSEVEETKQFFHDLFLSTKDNWLVNGLFNYYQSTNSLRAIEVLCGVREPHDKHLLDRLNETLARSTNSNQRVQALTVLGHIARRQPTWLYKLANHSLFKELLKLLKCDTDGLSIMSALLLLVTLLPMLPAALGPYLNDIFDIFGRLASYHHAQSNNLSMYAPASINYQLDKDQLYLLHLQLGIYSLFHRLYAMYPCNFIYFLKNFYTRDNDTVFKYTIKPMLDSVRMHPLIITASKDAEINAARWKKMEPHDVVAECGRFALDRNKEEILAPINSLRATPLLDQHYSYTPVSIVEGLLGSKANNGIEEDIFWSPSMTITPHSPTPIQSAPSTPNNNIINTNTTNNININTTNNSSSSINNSINNSRSNSSPPEAAIEATPETTPVKDIRQISTRQQTKSSTAVRALGAFGNGYSRPSTPIHTTSLSETVGIVEGGILSSKINRLFAERQNSLESQRKILETNTIQNGKNDSWNEDQEVLQIVNSRPRPINYTEQSDNYNSSDSSRKFKHIHSRYQTSISCPVVHPASQIRRSKSCLDLKFEEKLDKVDKIKSTARLKQSKDASIQVNDLIPYENLLYGVLDQRYQEQQTLKNNSESRLSPTSMLDKYIETCARINPSSSNSKNKKKGVEDNGNDDLVNEESASGQINVDYMNQQLQIIQIQLSFERQRREVHAERNRRLLGKLRDSRALEEHNTALTDRLRMTENEHESLKHEMDRIVKENRLAVEKFKESINFWQSKCVEEQQSNRVLKERVESLELELKKQVTKASECEKQLRDTDAMLFDTGHKLKNALEAASRGEELKRVFDNMQKRFLLLGEAQMKLQERMNQPVHMTKQEMIMIQKSYSEELTNLKKQADGRTSLIEMLKSRLAELEAHEVKKDEQLISQQRLLQEAKERHEVELRAIESKYKAQVEINLLLECRILELNGLYLESATTSGLANANLGSSVSPKERSTPLSSSLASSSEGSFAFHSNSGIIVNDYSDSGEISNLQAIVEPAPASSSTQNTPIRISPTKK